MVDILVYIIPLHRQGFRISMVNELSIMYLATLPAYLLFLTEGNKAW